MMSSNKRVAIIGAGASGLVCAKVLLDDGFNVMIFEKHKQVGGIWSEEEAYVDLHVQQPEGTMEFSDLFDGQEYAPWQHVHEYLEKYTDLFHLRERIRFQTQVISITKDDLKNEDIPWIIQSENVNGEKETNKFDFVVMATGLFSQPCKPVFQGQSKFAGSIVHPFEIKSTEQLENKRVLVVGCGKCATDMAILAGKYARSCYMIFRKAHWMIPQHIVGGLLPAKLLMTRAFSIPFSPIPNAPYGALFSFLHRKFPRLFLKMTNIIANDILSIHGPDFTKDKIFIPQHSFRNVENLSIISPDFIRLKAQSRIVGKLATINEILNETTVRLSTGEELQADLVISATGFVRQFPFFSENDAQSMGFKKINESIQLNLYRRILPVGIPNIAFVGFTTNVGYWMNAEVSSHWISDHFLKRLKLPKTKDEMYREIKQNQDFVLQTFNQDIDNYRYYWISLLEIYLNDMGVDLHRTNNWISEYFGVYRPQRLKGLHHERKFIFKKGYKPPHFYFSFTYNFLPLLFLILIYLFFLK